MCFRFPTSIVRARGKTTRAHLAAERATRCSAGHLHVGVARVKKLDIQIKGIEAELQKAPAEIVTAMQRRYEAAVSRDNCCGVLTKSRKGPLLSKRATRSI